MKKPYYKVDGYQSRRSVGYLLRRGSKLITTAVEDMFSEEDDVNFVQWVILMHLRDGLGSTAAELCDRLCHDSGALTRTLDQMENRGLLQRTRSQQDRRVVELHLTDKGRKITESYLPPLVGLYNSLFEDFTKEETDQMIDLLIRLNAKLAEHNGVKGD